MKTTGITLVAIVAIIIAACNTSKKSTTSTASSTTSSAPVSATTTATTTAPFLVMAKPSNGIYAPGNEELTAIQVQYKDVTLDQLTKGHAIYTEGACTNCHRAKNIYRHDVAQWKDIMDDMAQKAKISDEQKDAVYKYVLAIKAAQPK